MSVFIWVPLNGVLLRMSFFTWLRSLRCGRKYHGNGTAADAVGMKEVVAVKGSATRVDQKPAAQFWQEHNANKAGK